MNIKSSQLWQKLQSKLNFQHKIKLKIKYNNMFTRALFSKENYAEESLFIIFWTSDNEKDIYFPEISDF